MATYQYIFALIAITIASIGYFGNRKKKWSYSVYAFGFATTAQFFFLLVILPIVLPELSLMKQIFIAIIVCLGTIPIQSYAMKLTGMNKTKQNKVSSS